MTRSFFRTQKYDINMAEVKDLAFEKKFLFDRVIFYAGNKTLYLYLFKDKHDRGEKILKILERLRSKKAKATIANTRQSSMF
jgi:hypothetical protein